MFCLVQNVILGFLRLVSFPFVPLVLHIPVEPPFCIVLNLFCPALLLILMVVLFLLNLGLMRLVLELFVFTPGIETQGVMTFFVT